ncbi:hypothetical protein [Kangiella sp. HZ709]|uniref:hypothetical protein n=1 Tax=Kangiella sp. HZ709 TaxID=2666328 RepID=UPI0012B05B5A|nr:hypothetical protein [Kangiella sp. HZ709]MRX26593.1 hypothetical protein [Kangiella sp. HZ709]
MKKVINISALALVLISLPSKSKDISYDYFEFGYEFISVGEFESASGEVRLKFPDRSSQGLVLEWSNSLDDNYFIYADFDFTNLNLGTDIANFLADLGNVSSISPDVTINTQVFGLGFHTQGDMQFVSKLGVLRQKIDSDFVKEGTFGYELELGGRGLFTNNLEWEANLVYFDPDLNMGASGKLGANASLRYHFNSNFSTDVTTSFKENETTYGLNFRYNFD